jgi:short-subunit dehydrogenase
MKEKDSGRVVIISSIGALIPMPKSSIYAAVKSGIYSYGRSINEELENTNVSVTVSFTRLCSNLISIRDLVLNT